MIIHKLKKRSGGERTIYAPNHKEKLLLSLLVPRLNTLSTKLCPACVHGFMPQRSPVTNALAHVGKKFSVCFDLKDFFDSVTQAQSAQIESTLGEEDFTRLFVDSAPRQGLPTSPAVANIAAISMDYRLLDLARQHSAVYTRYADDLTFSCDQLADAIAIRSGVPGIIREFGFEVNPLKTRLLSAAAGRRIITGVSVDKDVRAPRAIRRRMRAAFHQRNTRHGAGLAEWSKMKTPVPGKVRNTKSLQACARWNSNAWFFNRGKQQPVPMS